MPSATTGSPLKRAKVRRSAMVSVTVPRSSSRTSPPPNSGIMVPASSFSVLAPASVRIAWSFLPISARPPARSTLVPRRIWLTSTGGQAGGLQPVGIERHENLALDTADALDLRDAAHALQRALDDVVDEIGQLLRRLAGRDRGIGDDRQADHVDALDQRLVDVLRQVGAHPGDGVLDVVERAVGVGLQRELDRGHRQAVGDRGGDMPHALDAGDAVLDGLGDLRSPVRPAPRRTARPRPRSPGCRRWAAGSRRAW